MFLHIKKNKSGFPWIFMEPKNCYQWVPMISGHGTEKLLFMGFEILGLDVGKVLILYWRVFVSAQKANWYSVNITFEWQGDPQEQPCK